MVEGIHPHIYLLTFFRESKCYFLVVLLREIPQTTSSKVSGSNPGHGWVVGCFFFLVLFFYLPAIKSLLS